MTRYLQFAAVVATALSLVPGGAHVLEFWHKMALDRDSYLVVQQIYAGWAYAGIVWVVALLLNCGVVIAVLRQPAARNWAVIAMLGFCAAFAVFFYLTFPVNVATNNWTVAAGNWEALRRQWEYSHLVNAAVIFLSFCAAVASSLAVRRADPA